MKGLLFIFVIFVLMMFSCTKKESLSHPLLDRAEVLLDSNIDSACILLGTILTPDQLTNSLFVRWCMLSGKVSDRILTPLLPSYQWERAQIWLQANGTVDEQAQVALYLGRAYMEEGEYERAMTLYLETLQYSKVHKLYNISGYICTYIADLYNFRDMQREALFQYEEAAIFFKKANNLRSHALALRNIAREWVFYDSLSYALNYLQRADSVAVLLNDNRLTSAMKNAFGNIYKTQNKYKEAEECYLSAMALDSTVIQPNSMALIDIYIRTNQLYKVRSIIERVPAKINNVQYQYSINNAYYKLYKAEGDYEKALYYYEKRSKVLDSISEIQNETKIMEVGKKYKDLRYREENTMLKMESQRYVIILCVCISISLLFLLTYLYYRKRTLSQIYLQQKELDRMNIELLNTSLELEAKKRLLATQKDNSEMLQTEIEELAMKYRQLQKSKLMGSVIAKKLVTLVSKMHPGNSQSLLSDKLWSLLIAEVEDVYPAFRSCLLKLCPTLTGQEWQYCCLYLFGFDSNDEARLLDISPESVRTKRMRIRQRLNISLNEGENLYDYFMSNLFV